MKILSLFAILLISASIFVIGQNPIQVKINNFSNDPALSTASISFKLVDLSDGSVVAEYNPNTTLPTASTAKLFSTSTALEILGPNYRPNTRVYYDGEIDTTGILNGNIYVRGGGDPSLGSKFFHNESTQKEFLSEWVNQIKNAGIKQIEGQIIADASEFGYKGAPDGWSWVDLGNYYGAGPSGLSIFDNMINIRFKTSGYSNRQSTIISITPEVPNMQLTNYVMSSTIKGDNAYIYGAPYSLDRFATGTLPINSSNFLVKGSLPDPEYQFAYELITALGDADIEVLKGISTARSGAIHSTPEFYTDKTLLIEHKGQELINVINYTNMRSVNHFAEHMISLIGYEKTGNGDSDSGLSVLRSFWSNHFNTSGMQINDGSGLSRSNAISASNFVDMLRYMHQSINSTTFRESLPIAGVSGTLKSVCQGQTAHNRMRAKSGSMTRIKSYAGYIDSNKGNKYAFALIVNNYTCSSSAMKAKMESLFNAIAAH